MPTQIEITKALDLAKLETNTILHALNTFNIGRSILIKAKEAAENAGVLTDKTSSIRMKAIDMLNSGITADSVKEFFELFRQIPDDDLPGFCSNILEVGSLNVKKILSSFVYIKMVV